MKIKTHIMDIKIIILFIAIAMNTHAYCIDISSTRGIINNWPIAPMQTGLGYNTCPYLFDGNSNAIFSLTPIGIEQKSSIVSFSGLNGLKYNYGVQLAWLACESEINYGISYGITNTSEDNYGLSFGIVDILSHNCGFQIGFFNESEHYHYQMFGINIASTFRIAALNFDTQSISNNIAVDIGFFNIGSATSLQIGILNYNVHALIPCFPFFNFCITQEEGMDGLSY